MWSRLARLAGPGRLWPVGLAILLVGCVSDRSPAGRSSTPATGDIEEIHLLSAPAALNFDGVAGADGFAVRIYASGSKSPKTLTIEEGTLEILMFEGVIDRTALASAQPKRVWSYSAKDLAESARRTSIGTSYEFAVLWQADRPRSGRITVVARYARPGGARIYSAPAVVFVTAS